MQSCHLQKRAKADLSSITWPPRVVKNTHGFTNRSFPGKACFVGECEVGDCIEDLEQRCACSICGSKTHVDSSKMQHVLEHMGAHILYNSANLWNQEVHGLCLRPAPICQIYMKKQRWDIDHNFTVNTKPLSCVDLIKCFSCSVASEGTESSPCTNFPTNCSLFPPKSVWLKSEFKPQSKTMTTHTILAW